MTFRIDVAVVNWGTPDSAVASARAFVASEDADVHVVIADNPSTPAAREELRAALEGTPRTTLLELEENVGFGRAANAALRGGSGDLICVANADVAPEAHMLRQLAGDCDDPGVAFAAPRFGDDRDGYHSLLPTPLALLGRPIVGGLGARPAALGDGATPVEQPAGACLVARRALWEELGGFDESFFLWYEDVDLAARSRAAGYRNVVDGRARATHLAGESAGRVDGPTAQAIRLRSLRRYVELHHPRLVGPLEPVLLLAAFVRLGWSDAGRARRRELLRGPASRRWRRVVRPGDARG